jgi:hypothetical protein
VYRDDFEMAVSLFKEDFGFRVLRRKGSVVWMRQEKAMVDLQLSASDTKPETKEFDIAELRKKNHREICDKSRSQIAFLSERPEEDLKKIVARLENKGYRAFVLGFSDKEFFLDVPDVFVDFVIEAMTPECAEYGKE